MMYRAWRPALQMALLGLVCANAATAVSVKVSVTGKTGAPSADTIVVFDPLDGSPTPTHDTAVIDQINKTFVPRVNVMRTGTVVAFPNSDRIRHQVYSFSTPPSLYVEVVRRLTAHGRDFRKAGDDRPWLQHPRQHGGFRCRGGFPLLQEDALNPESPSWTCRPVATDFASGIPT